MKESAHSVDPNQPLPVEALSVNPNETTVEASVVKSTTQDSTAGRQDFLGGASSIPGYRITGEIAKGGMGCVYVGYDVTLDREVAIKTLLPRADAERVLHECLATHAEAPTADANRLRLQQRIPETIDRLIELYTATNKPEEVKKWQAEKARRPKPSVPKEAK